jgi:hypothetical protein
MIPKQQCDSIRVPTRQRSHVAARQEYIFACAASDFSKTALLRKLESVCGALSQK